MVKIYKNFSIGTKEFVFQLALHLLVFFFYASSRNHPQIMGFEVVFFLNSAFLAFIINYILLPTLLYEKKYVKFLVFLLMAIVFAVLVEELVLEQIFFPDTRGSNFPGVVFTLLGILPVSIILVAFKTGWDAFIKQRELENLQSTVKESELQFLKSQINPHFLFNNLNNLYAHAIEQSPKTPEIILELSGVLRYMLYDCKAMYVSLDKEVEHLRNFVNISELQIEDRGIVQFSSHIKPGYRVAPLIMTVFVENAFKHSTASLAKDIEIDINVEVSSAGVLEFYCGNTYHAQTNTNSLSSGIGLENVRKRLELLYPGDYTLEIKPNPEKYEVFLSLNLNNVGS